MVRFACSVAWSFALIYHQSCQLNMSNRQLCSSLPTFFAVLAPLCSHLVTSQALVYDGISFISNSLERKAMRHCAYAHNTKSHFPDHEARGCSGDIDSSLSYTSATRPKSSRDLQLTDIAKTTPSRRGSVTVSSPTGSRTADAGLSRTRAAAHVRISAHVSAIAMYSR